MENIMYERQIPAFQIKQNPPKRKNPLWRVCVKYFPIGVRPSGILSSVSDCDLSGLRSQGPDLKAMTSFMKNACIVVYL